MVYLAGFRTQRRSFYSTCAKPCAYTLYLPMENEASLKIILWIINNRIKYFKVGNQDKHFKSLCICVYLVVYTCTVCIQEPKKVRVGIGCSGTGVTDDWELLCCVLGIKLGSFGRTNVLSPWAITPAPRIKVLSLYLSKYELVLKETHNLKNVFGNFCDICSLYMILYYIRTFSYNCVLHSEHVPPYLPTLPVSYPPPH